MSSNTHIGRRRFLRQLGAGAALAAGTAAGMTPTLEQAAAAMELRPHQSGARRNASYRLRKDAARLARQRPPVTHLTNGDEERYPNRIGNFTKGLPHDGLGEVAPTAYAALQRALASGAPADFEAIPLGLGRLLVNPQAGLAFDLEGPDSHHCAMRPAPALASAEAAGELVELYWMALLRDLPFTRYNTDPTVAAAAAELTRLSDFRGPKVNGQVTPATLFRGSTPGDLVGPYLSQFLWRDIPMGALHIPQRMYTVPPARDYLTTWAEWLAVQNGFEPEAYELDPTPRYIRNLRDLAEWVHVDALFQAYHQAALILLGLEAPVATGNPYRHSATQMGFGTFGGPHVLSLVTEVATRALKTVWYQKWFVHRRLRPEAMGGLVHHTRLSTRAYPLPAELVNAAAVDAVYNRQGSYLLPQAAPEGSPLHPSYGAGHATVAGACVTILKAWFDESYELPDPVIPTIDGTALEPYHGPALTVGNELNKLAANVALGRNGLGVHYRSDYWESLRLGEEVALAILEEQSACYNERGAFTLTRFDGARATV